MKTEQRSLRLSQYHLMIVAGLQKEKGYTFTDSIKHIIDEFSKFQSNENSINRLLQKLEKNLIKTNLSTDDTSLFDIQEFLIEIRNNTQWIKKVLMILGSADSRTLVQIEDLLKGD